jgi:AraC-like DNA-binding protein
MGGIARAACAEAEKAGAKVAPLVAQAGLTMQQLSNPQLRFPVRDQVKILNLVAKAIGDDLLGFRLAQKFDLRELGLLYYAQSSSDTLDSALLRLARYSRITNESITITYTKGKFLRIAFDHAGVRRLDDTHQIEFFMVTLVRVCRQLTRRHLVPQTVSFVHRRSAVPAEMTRYFGRAATFGAQADAITLQTSDADLPLTDADAYLNSLLEKYCKEALAKQRTGAGTWRTKVENEISSLLPHGQAKLPTVAKRLAVSPRTLARRLEVEDTTFAEIVDRLRFELAKSYLKEHKLPISEVSWLLGYAEPSAFSHAFRRWTGGTSPIQARAKAS